MSLMLNQTIRKRTAVVKSVLADQDTPVSTYMKIANTPYTYLLESVEGTEQWGRYSIIGLEAKERVCVKDKTIEVIRDGQVIYQQEHPQPFDFLQQYLDSFQVDAIPGLPRFHGGLVGYFGYDTISYIEPKLQQGLPDELQHPDISLLLSDELVVFDSLKGVIYIVVHVDSDLADAKTQAHQRIDEIVSQMRQSKPEVSELDLTSPQKVNLNDFQLRTSQADFEASVETIRDYIQAGDVMQVVLSQRMSINFKPAPIDLYRALRFLNPSPYMYLLHMGDFHIVGSSPEILTRVEDQKSQVRPLAGTRRRGATPEEDLALEQELLADPKEIAEHVMLIDLGRNDLGRVSQAGRVKLTETNIIERYSHVMHLVSNVEGHLRDDVTALDVLKATFPAGTLSGAPKVRAMEIIEELEPCRRGVYGGAVGYLNWCGDMDLAIAIRTAVIQEGRLYLQVGAGVVADSVPSREWQETLDKGKAMVKAVNLALSVHPESKGVSCKGM